jgi:hypothetical protein
MIAILKAPQKRLTSESSVSTHTGHLVPASVLWKSSFRRTSGVLRTGVQGQRQGAVHNIHSPTPPELRKSEHSAKLGRNSSRIAFSRKVSELECCSPVTPQGQESGRLLPTDNEPLGFEELRLIPEMESRRRAHQG